MIKSKEGSKGKLRSWFPLTLTLVLLFTFSCKSNPKNQDNMMPEIKSEASHVEDSYDLVALDAIASANSYLQNKPPEETVFSKAVSMLAEQDPKILAQLMQHTQYEELADAVEPQIDLPTVSTPQTDEADAPAALQLEESSAAPVAPEASKNYLPEIGLWAGASILILGGLTLAVESECMVVKDKLESSFNFLKSELDHSLSNLAREARSVSTTKVQSALKIKENIELRWKEIQVKTPTSIEAIHDMRKLKAAGLFIFMTGLTLGGLAAWKTSEKIQLVGETQDAASKLQDELAVLVVRLEDLKTASALNLASQQCVLGKEFDEFNVNLKGFQALDNIFLRMHPSTAVSKKYLDLWYRPIQRRTQVILSKLETERIFMPRQTAVEDRVLVRGMWEDAELLANKRKLASGGFGDTYEIQYKGKSYSQDHNG